MEGNVFDSADVQDGDNTASGIDRELRELTEAMTMPWLHECLVCYIFRMLEYGCRGQQWMQRYRDVCAPRATALELRMARVGGYCDCEVLMNAFLPSPRYFMTDDDGEVVSQPMLPCLSVRSGSTQPCRLWITRAEYELSQLY